MTAKAYRMIEHTADTGFEVTGSTKEKLFESAARAFFSIIYHIEKSRPAAPEVIEVAGSDLEELMVNFLEEFLYLYEAREKVCTDLQVENISGESIRARVWLRQFDPDSDRELLGVKAVTYHQLFVGPQDDAWLARIFLDI